MHPIAPFRPPHPRPHPHYSSRSSNPGPQFASTPRFLFSQTQSQRVNDDDATESPSTARWSDKEAGSTLRRREVIEDAGDEQAEDELGTSRPPKDAIFDDSDSSPPEAAGEVDSEFEDLFAPTERAKRRRVVEDAHAHAEAVAVAVTPLRTRDDNTILTSSPPEQSPNKPEPPVTPFPRCRPRQDQSVAAPMMGPSTPGPASAKPSFPRHPRFVLSASQQAPPSSQSTTPFTPAPAPASQTPASTSTSRRRPAFVLPRSPSPSREDEDAATLPTPFSPSSRTLHRRGRARSSALGYMAGGMAAEVRSWVLEMGTKREQLQPSPGRQSSLVDMKRYMTTARITKIRQTTLGNSGPLAFVEGRIVQQPASTSALEDVGESRNILLMGSPRFRPGYPDLRADSVIGVYRGLVWEIELNKEGPDDLLKGSPSPAGLTDCTDVADAERWLVVLEWDLL